MPTRALAAGGLVALLVQTTPAPRSGTVAAIDLRAHVPALQKNLETAVVGFWYPRVMDRTHGGYRVAFDRDGRPTADGSKMIVTQARMTWLFARLARAGYRSSEMLDAAAHGYRFLADRMWDREHGGFVWDVDESGTRVQSAAKVVYGQAFALYALSEYARASGRPEPLALATRLFRLLEKHARDATYGGYVELLDADWSAPDSSVASPIGGRPGAKLMNTHLHLLEAYAEFLRAGGPPLARERLLELVTIQSNTVVRKDLTACTDEYRRDWTPVLDEAGAIVSYGHDLENIWLLADAVETAGQSNALLVDLYRQLFAYSERYGYDAAAGGFFYRGGFREPAAERAKVWWVQAEALVSALTMYRLTREPEYAGVFTKTLEWVTARQTDWTNGEWFAEVRPDGSVHGVKGDRWKEGYHNGRALIESIRIIEELSRSSNGQPTGGR
jgi:mannose/cellobiose epimerase-like protein (N-acyl-D-glucosamine 2-epimerase family)